MIPNQSIKIAAGLIMTLGFAVTSFAKDNWPVNNFTFTYNGAKGWTPNSVKVKEGAEVNLNLINKGPATACFSIVSAANKVICDDQCIQAKSEGKYKFFANYPKGKYQIRNSWETSKEGVFSIE